MSSGGTCTDANNLVNRTPSYGGILNAGPEASSSYSIIDTEE